MSRLSFSDIELRGQKVDIDLHVLEPEHDVGIMGYGFEDESITDADGKVLDWELTEEEILKINELVSDHAYNDEPDLY
jgi:hypothetical protein